MKLQDLLALSILVPTSFFGGSLAFSQSGAAITDEARTLIEELIDGEKLTLIEDQTSQSQTVQENEPNNNRFGSAGNFRSQDKLAGTIAPKGDVDWWRMRTNRPGELVLSAKTAPPELNLAVRVWSMNKKDLTGWVTAQANGLELHAVVDLPHAGDFVLELRDGGNDSESATPYELGAVFTPVPEINEVQANHYGSPTLVPIDSVFPLTILPRGDVDYVAVDAPQQGQLSIKVGQPPENLDVAVRVWDPNGKDLTGWKQAPAVGEPLDIIADLSWPGRYTLEIRDGNNDSRSIQSFEMTLAFRPADTQEPNDQWHTATVIELGQDLQATILPRGDVDYFLIDLPQAGELTVSITESPKDLDLALRVWTPDVKDLSGWKYPLVKGGDGIHRIDLPIPGRYRLEVRDGNNDARSPDLYRLQTSFISVADAAEPNGFFSSATSVRLGQTIQANILPRGEVDYYAVDVPAQGALTLAITNPPENLDIAMRVWTPGLKDMSGWMSPSAKGGENIQTVDIPSPGRYLIEVRDGNNDARSHLPYSFTPTLQETKDLFEPNNWLSEAASINLGDSVEAALMPMGEVDWYRVDVSERGILRTIIDISPAELNMSVRIWNADLKTVSNWASAPALGEVLDMPFEIEEGGTYFLEVRDGNNDARSPERYRLTTSWEPFAKE